MNATHQTATGRTVTTTTRSGRCEQPDLGSADVRAVCGRPGTEVSCDPGVPGRDIVSECLCDAHGGIAVATARVLRDWCVAAPPEVGGEYAVQEAGCLALNSRDVYVVARQENDRFVAAIGIGSFTQQVRRQDADPERARKASPAHRTERPTTSRRGGGNSWPTRDEAVAAGIEAWSANVARSIATITAARGGTLEWGLAVAPLAEPVVLLPERGQSAYAADRARELVAAMPGCIVDRVVRSENLMATRIAVGRHEVLVHDDCITYVDGANWSPRSVEEIAAHVSR